MFSRTAVIIATSLLAVIAAFFICAAFLSERAGCRLNCERNIARPYELLLSRIGQLADAGQTEELRKLIIEAQKRSSDVSYVCVRSGENIYAIQVGELTQ
jgi:hypothetical protein